MYNYKHMIQKGKHYKVKKKIFIRTVGIITGIAIIISSAMIPASAVSKIKSISINTYDKTITIKKGSKLKLSASVKPAKLSKKIKWKSSNKKIVKVSKNGTIKGLKKGNAVITASATDGSGKKAKINVTVGTKVSSVTLSNVGDTKTVYVGNNYTLKTTVKSAKASNKKLRWYSSNKNIVTVSNGVITPKKNGTAKIKVISTDGTRKSDSVKITVKTHVKSISISPAAGDEKLMRSQSVKLNTKITPSAASNKEVTYKSSDTEIAKVDQTGKVTAVGVGMVTITATTKDSSKSDKYTFWVYPLTSSDCGFVAHRGLSDKAPENTIPAFELAAKETGYSAIETDIWETTDGEFVLLHNQSLLTMCGVDKNINELSLAQVKSYTIKSGSNISKYPNLKIPTLEEYLKVLAKYPNATAQLELKDCKFSETVYDEEGNVIKKGAYERLLDLLNDYDLLDRTCFSSFQQDKLLALKKVFESSEYRDKTVRFQRIEKEASEAIAQWCQKYEMDFGGNVNYLSKSLVDKFHKLGVKVSAYTINDSYKAYMLVHNWGLDYITTDGLIFEN